MLRKGKPAYHMVSQLLVHSILDSQVAKMYTL